MIRRITKEIADINIAINAKPISLKDIRQKKLTKNKIIPIPPISFLSGKRGIIKWDIKNQKPS